MAKDMIRMVLVALSVVAVLLSSSQIVHADDGDKGNSDTVIDIGISGDVQVGIGASGPAELNVDAKGPAQVSIDAGDEVNLNVEASDESQILIEGQGIDGPAGQQETEYENPAIDLDNSPLELDDTITRLDNYTMIITAAFPAVGLLAFCLISYSIEHGQIKQLNERGVK